MLNAEFALGTWEINLQDKEEREHILNNMKYYCRYIDTAIDYNNDYLLKDIQSQYTIISKISSYHYDEYEFFVSNHLKCLNIDTIDIMLIHSNRGNWRPLAKKMSTDARFKEIGISNFTVNEIEEFKDITGAYPKYCEIEINPYYLDKDVIDFCKNHNIKIIAYGIFGGKYNATRNIADFSLPYMMSFASHYADIIIVKPECRRHENEIIDVIQNFEPYNLSYEPVDTTNKAIEPMKYDASKLFSKLCLGFPTYHNAVGNNSKDGLNKEELNIDLPNFEMLGDYLTYIRYKFRQNYNGNLPIYYYDFLIGDDEAYYSIYLYDTNDKITKINELNKVKLFRYSKKI